MILLSSCLEYPRELHMQHGDYHVALEVMIINKEMLSDYQYDLLFKLNYKVVN
jgi:hypothetical protein